VINAITSRKDFFESLLAIATIIALVVGGAWTYKLTSQYRETVPKLTIVQKASSWRLRDGSTLLRIDSILTNAGKVKIEGVTGKMIVWRLLPETDKQAKDFETGNYLFSCKDERGNLYPNCVPAQGLNLPPESKAEFDMKYPQEGLEPGESQPYWFYFRSSGDVSTVEVYTVVTKPKKSNGDWIFDSTFDLNTAAAATSRDLSKASNQPKPKQKK